MSDNRNACRILVRRTEGKGQLIRPKQRWQDNIKMNLKYWNSMAWYEYMWFSVGTRGKLELRQH